MRKLFISLCLSACYSLLSAQISNPIQEAMTNYNYEAALLLIEQESPTIPLLYQKGKALKGLGNNLEALSVFQEVVSQDSLNPRAYIEAAECSKSLAKYGEALDYYQNALHINPDNKYVRIQYISLLMNMKRYRESLRESNLLAEKDSSFQTCFYAGISYYALEDFYPAHDLLDRALKDDHTNINVLYYLGRACSKTSWKEDGVIYLETAVNLAMPSDSVMSRLYVGLADCYKMAFQYTDQANTLLTQYEKYDRQKHRLLYDAAFIYYYYLKDESKAEQYLMAYLKTRPKENKKQEVDEDGVPIIGEDNRYNAAEAWLKDLRKRRKEESFFKGKVEEEKKE